MNVDLTFNVCAKYGIYDLIRQMQMNIYVFIGVSTHLA